MWFYGIITSVSSVLVWSNLDWYDYNIGFRIWRYIIFAISLIFCAFYITEIISVIVMFERNKSQKFEMGPGEIGDMYNWEILEVV